MAAEKTNLCFIIISLQCYVVAATITTYPTCFEDTLKFDILHVNTEQTPYDFFALSRRSTCGKRAGTVTGTGSFVDPYRISVDLSQGLLSQSPDCGVEEVEPGHYRLTVRTAMACEGPTANDISYTVDCYLTLTPSPTSATTVISRSANYTCEAPSTILFTYSQNSAAPPFDIYAKGRELTCSLSANQGSGTGTTSDPYVLQIDTASASLASADSNQCGVKVDGTDTYSVVMYVQQRQNLITIDDVSYALTCNFSLLVSQVISSETLPVSSNIPVDVAKKNQPVSSLFVVSASSSHTSRASSSSSANSASAAAEAVLSSFAVGDPVRLAAKLISGPATGLRVRQCTASPGVGLLPQLAILNEKGCTAENRLVPPFVSLQSSTDATAMTDKFKAFRFKGHDTVFFRCVVDFCYGENDLACAGTHCDDSKRRKRDADNVKMNETVNSDIISAYLTIRSDADMHANRTVDGSLSPVEPRRRKRGNSAEQWPPSYIAVVTSLTLLCVILLLCSIALATKLVLLNLRLSSTAERSDSKMGADNR